MFDDSPMFADDLLEHCDFLQEEGRAEEAIALLDEAIVDAPEEVEFWLLLGRLKAMYVSIEKGIEDLLTAKRLAPENIEVYQSLSWVCWHDETFFRSEHYARQAIAIDETDPYSYELLGNSFLWQKRYGAAKEVYQTVLTLDPINISAWAGLRDACIALEEFDEAVGYVEYLVEYEPRAFHCAKLARLHLQLGNFSDVFPYLEQAEALLDDEEEDVLRRSIALLIKWYRMQANTGLQAEC